MSILRDPHLNNLQKQQNTKSTFFIPSVPSLFSLKILLYYSLETLLEALLKLQIQILKKYMDIAQNEKDLTNTNTQSKKLKQDSKTEKLIVSEQDQVPSKLTHLFQQNIAKNLINLKNQIQHSNRKKNQVESQDSESGASLRSESTLIQEKSSVNQSSSNKNINLNFLIDDIIEEKQLNIKSLKAKNHKSEGQKQELPISVAHKKFEIRMDDIKMYNSKFLSRLQQLQINFNLIKMISESSQQRNIKEQMNEPQSSSFLSFIKISLRFPQWLQSFDLFEQNEMHQKNDQIQFEQKLLCSQSRQKVKGLKLEEIFLVVEYHKKNIELQKFIIQQNDQQYLSIERYTTNNFLTNEQINLIRDNFNQFQEYVASKSLNELFLINEIQISEIFCHQSKISHIPLHKKDNIFFKKPTLLQKIIAIRKFFKIIQNSNISNKPNIKKHKLNAIINSKNTSKSQQLYGNKQLIDQLQKLYCHEKKIQSENPLTQINKLNQTDSPQKHIKFVQFVPKLNINTNNYSQFLTQVTQIKKVYFNGLAVGFQGFRISNFTNRSQNNITFVFHQFHQLVQLQSLLIDFQFPLNYIQQIKKQYLQFPNKKLKKIRIKFHVAQKGKNKNQFIPKYGQDYYKKHDQTKNPHSTLGKNISFLQTDQNKSQIFNNNHRFMNSTMVNSSFFLQPSGYYERIQQKSSLKEYAKEFYFYKLEKESPDYQRLIKHLNSLSSVSKTLIIKFESIFSLIHLRDSLNQLINICSDFSSTELQMLPQPFEMMNIHADYKVNLVTLKEQVRQLLENEDKFGCLGFTRSGKKIPMQKLNSINSFNMVKVHEQYLLKKQLFLKIEKDFSQYSAKYRPIFNHQFEQTANCIQLLLPHPKAKSEFICFPFHNKTYKIVKYFEPGTMNLLNLQLKETNQRSQNFLPAQENTINQHKNTMVKQGLDFFYYSYPFGDKFKLPLTNYHIYSLTFKNQIKFNKVDHLRVLYWLGKINRIENKIVFYQNPLSKPYLIEEAKKKYFAETFIKQKLPSFDQVYDIGFLDEYLKSKIVQIQVLTPNQTKQKNQKLESNIIFKKAIQRIDLEGSNLNKVQKLQIYKIKTNRTTWDLILKKLKQICDQKQSQLRKLTVSEQDDKQFKRLKDSLKKTTY